MIPKAGPTLAKQRNHARVNIIVLSGCRRARFARCPFTYGHERFAHTSHREMSGRRHRVDQETGAHSHYPHQYVR